MMLLAASACGVRMGVGGRTVAVGVGLPTAAPAVSVRQTTRPRTASVRKNRIIAFYRGAKFGRVAALRVSRSGRRRSGTSLSRSDAPCRESNATYIYVTPDGEGRVGWALARRAVRLYTRGVNALPEVTAVVLHYGSAAPTRRCLDRLAASEYPRLSVLIVNNSPAEPWRLARLPAPTVITPPTNTGYAGGNNLGLRALRDAQRDGYALLLNNDAELAPAAIAALVACAETDPRIAFVGARVAAPDGAALDHGRVTFGPYLVARPAPRAPAAVDAQWVSGCALLVRLAALPTIGLLDEEFFLYGEDVEWCLRARAPATASSTNPPRWCTTPTACRPPPRRGAPTSSRATPSC